MAGLCGSITCGQDEALRWGYNFLQDEIGSIRGIGVGVLVDYYSISITISVFVLITIIL